MQGFTFGRPVPAQRPDSSHQWSNKRRGAGWDFVHVCIDDHSRVAFSEIKLDEPAAVREPDED